MEKLRQMNADSVRNLGLLAGDWWENDLYRVLVVKGKPWDGKSVVQLSIKRHDGKAIDPLWREKQQIKNELVGNECEGVEIFPAESRVQNQSHQYHLWVIDDPNFRFTDWFGWKDQRATLDDDIKSEIVEE